MVYFKYLRGGWFLLFYLTVGHVIAQTKTSVELQGTSKNGTFLRGRRLIYAVRTQGLCFASDR